MKSLILIAAAATAVAIAAPAFAQDIDPTFTGPRVEGFGGVDFQDYRYRPMPAGIERRHTGGVAGILGGFDIGVSNLVIGGFASYALPTSNGCSQLPATSRGACVRPDREIEGGARIGVKFGSRALVYGKGAYVNTSVKIQSRGLSGTTPTFLNSHVNRDGWRVGGGVEYAITEHAYVKAEYDYTRTDRVNLSLYGFPGTDYRVSKSQVLGGFGIRF